MGRRLLTVLSLIAGGLYAACEGPASAPPPVPETPLAQLEAATGHQWTLRRHPLLQTPAFLEGRTEPMATTPKDADRAARAFLNEWHALFSLSSADVELATVSSATDELGMTHVHYAQRVARVPVWGGDLKVHFASDGALVRINGRYAPLIAPPSLVPTFTSDEARVVAATLARRRRPAAPPSAFVTETPELVLFPIEAGMVPGSVRTAVIAWRVVADTIDVDEPLRLELLLDGTDGHVLADRDLIQRVMGSGVGVFGDRKPLSITEKKVGYWLEDATRGGSFPSRTYSADGRARLPGSELRSPDPNAWDLDTDERGAAVDAHAYVAASWDYFLAHHHRAGWGPEGAGIRATVHFGDHVRGAYFDGARLAFGDGDQTMTTAAASFDIVAHEYAHGVIAATASLEPTGEPGAVTEGLADLFGCFVSWSSGQGARWQIGETVFHPRGHHLPLRDLGDPHATGQPASTSEIVAGYDLGEDGEHENASIVGHLGYLLVEGGQGVRPMSVDDVGRLVYRTLVYLFPRAGFADFTDAFVAATRDLDGSDEANVTAALVAVGLR